MSQIGTTLERHWAPLAQAAVWVGGLVGTFMAAPPLLSLTEEPGALLKFLQFVLAIIYGLAFLVSAIGNSRKQSLKKWITITIILLIAAIVSFFGYQHLKQHWTCLYATKHILVKGETLTPDAQAYVGKSGMSSSCDKLLAEYGGRTEEVWNRDEIERRHTMLVLLFSLAWLLSATTVISTIQAVRYGRRR